MWAKSVAVGTAITAVALAAGVLGGTSATAAPAATGEVTIIHGVRGLLADVWVDGKQALSSFSPERVTDPITLPAGSHKVEIRQHGASATSKPAVSATLGVPANGHLSVAAGLRANGSPVLWQFNDNDLRSLLGAGAKGSGIVVRNLAATPDVHAVVDKRTLAVPTSPGAISLAVSAGNHLLGLRSDATSKSLLPTETVATQAGRVTVVYLIGSAKDSSLGWLAETVQPGVTATKAATPPRKVDTGNSGLAAKSTGGGVGGPIIWAILGVAVLAAGLRVWRPRLR